MIQWRSSICLCFAVALLLPAPGAAQSPAPTPGKGDDIIFGCEGEGCGCSGETKTNRKFALYEEMNAASERLGEWSAPVAAKPGDAFSLVKAPGRYRVKAVKKPVAGVKVGDTLERLFSEGEGFFFATLRGRKISFEGDDLELVTLEPTKLETWYQVSVGALHGYSRIFPFRGCLE